jgi:predicted Zn-dependent protease
MRFWFIPFLLILAQLAAPLASAFSAKDAPPRAADYGNAPQVGLYHWRRLPVRVYFEKGDAYTEERQQLAQLGFDQWAAATDGILDYTVVDTLRSADVTVRFLPGGNVPPKRNTIGLTSVYTQGRSLRKARMELATRVSRPEDLTEVAAHEWGHALGINGHSDDRRDLMYAVTTRYISLGDSFSPPARTVSERDLNTIKRAYPSLFPKR